MLRQDPARDRPGLGAQVEQSESEDEILSLRLRKNKSSGDPSTIIGWIAQRGVSTLRSCVFRTVGSAETEIMSKMPIPPTDKLVSDAIKPTRCPSSSCSLRSTCCPRPSSSSQASRSKAGGGKQNSSDIHSSSPSTIGGAGNGFKTGAGGTATALHKTCSDAISNSSNIGKSSHHMPSAAGSKVGFSSNTNGHADASKARKSGMSTGSAAGRSRGAEGASILLCCAPADGTARTPRAIMSASSWDAAEESERWPAGSMAMVMKFAR
mmetsp:Transcript_52753/g.170299  ORF Transcript_52753/g.170299 Transcript_52753/m.170299 type:complete len:266 (-) Transcript_52753:36-833(-)